MKTGSKIALAGIVCALSLVVMLLTALPTLTVGLPVLAGALLMVLVIELGVKWGFLGYLTVAFLGLLLTPSLESKLLFVLFFGYYPVVKALLERLNSKILSFGAKLLLFNAAMVVAYFILMKVTSAVDTADFMIFGMYLPWVVLLFGNVVFLVYDVALTRVIATYLRVWQPRLHKLLR